MAVVIAGIGVPGSGKTTLLKSYASQNGCTYISPDDIREEISGDARIQADMRIVWETAYARMKDSIAQGRSVVFDATQYKPRDRKDFIEHARASKPERIIGVYFLVPIEVALERNRSRERVVPEHAIIRMHTMLEQHPPTIAEGFDSIESPDWLSKG